ncbi:MAG: bifunctional indole-3-glycerol phosphate synthase/phosphoribosylanthranilate isomerase, partial [Phycisphaerales bacterium]|nr:bifunctional indole-3-glycerol phosphate synthase/phosphoribosylanthranilate isomerase [Phycisphaerales bacterium]
IRRGPRRTSAGPRLAGPSASPSVGVLAPGSEADATAFVVKQALTYANHGASAVSVLTEPTAFGGDLEHARAAAAELRPFGVPVMRKDFLIDPAQVYEARIAGCSGVLLIIRMLDDDRQLDLMLHAGRECDLFVLLEAFDHADLGRAREILADASHSRGISSHATNPSSPAPVLVGLNTRDLETLAVNRNHASSISPGHFPLGLLRIAESGMSTPSDVRDAAANGYDGVLVGTALMRSDDPGALLDRMIEAGSHPDARVVLGSGSHTPPARTRVKICGLTTRSDVDAAVNAGADAIGLVMVDSVRRASVPFFLDTIVNLPAFVQLVTVYRDGALTTPMPECDETPAWTTYQRDASAALASSEHCFDDCTIPVLRLGTPSFHDELEACATRFHTLLIEGPRSGVGETVDWHAVAPIARTHRIILAGGLTPDNVGEAIRIVRPYAVDVSSGVESSPGVKDPTKIAAFLAAVRAADERSRESQVARRE